MCWRLPLSATVLEGRKEPPLQEASAQPHGLPAQPPPTTLQTLRSPGSSSVFFFFFSYSASVSLFASLSVFLSLPLCLSPSHCLSLTPCKVMCLCLSLYISVGLSLSPISITLLFSLQVRAPLSLAYTWGPILLRGAAVRDFLGGLPQEPHQQIIK